jgi:penicillin-binding protein 2
MADLNTQKLDDLRGRHKYFAAFMVLAFFLLFLRLWYIQVIKGSDFLRLSENNCIRIRETPADRGMMLDARGRVLAHNRPSFEAYLVPEDLKGNPEVLEKAAEALRTTPEEIREKMKNARRRAPFKPVKIKADISWNELAYIEGNRVYLPGLFVGVRPVRAYNYGPLASHLIGYIGEVDETDLRRSDSGGTYRMGSVTGKFGVEQRWEVDLRGVDGGRQIEVDSMGREVRPLQSAEPFPGSNVYLTIDLDLQRQAEEAFGEKNGALIAMDPRSGRILAMVSRPAFDPGLFARSITPGDWAALSENPAHPLQNKTVQGQYPPGSVFKIITAIAALESGVITPQTQLLCTGVFTYGNRDFRCVKEGGHGHLNLHRALVASCDTFFYQLGLRVGVDRIAHYAREFGLGRPTGVFLPNEKPGLIPSTAWKQKRFGVPWYSGETLSVAVGQGYVNATPLQLAGLISAVANGGRLFLPTVVDRVENIDGEPLKGYPPVETGRANVSPATLRFIQDALAGAVNEPGGTGWAAALKEFKVAGKTGTAQVVRMEKNFRRGDTERLPSKFRDHAWFVGYAPVNDPRIAVVALVEHGGFGGAVAAPIVRKVMEKYFGLEPSAPQREAGKAVNAADDD